MSEPDPEVPNAAKSFMKRLREQGAPLPELGSVFAERFTARMSERLRQALSEQPSAEDQN